MDWYKGLALALVVGVIGPLFWLCVNVFENWLKGRINLLKQRWRSRKAQQAASAHRRLL